MRLLIIEDNTRLAELVADGLGKRGFSCDVSRDLGTTDLSLATAAYDVMILDLGLPDGDGLDWLRQQRRIRSLPPALILTARDALEDRIEGLDAGADDYLPKPFDMDELAARLRALLRRPGARTPVSLTAGPLIFDTVGRIARSECGALDLTRRESDLLELLMRKAGMVVRRAAIEEAIYSFNETVTPNAVDAVVSRLRRKLEAAGAQGLLHTVRGVGYILRETAA